ncbi:hypothetical protein DVH24_010698 [Malus domestica]|uniref:Uncharacterized protein n=1 Tax=Malus domestica TaxID=3750 RepID=A0A498JWN6_MALDO|nr:hypothetical protein DVH24_010698 [Malus domestica]
MFTTTFIIFKYPPLFITYFISVILVCHILRFKVTLILEDASDETIVEKGFTDQQELPDAILQFRGQIKNFQLQFGNLKNDFLIQAIFNDKIQVIQSSSKASYESMIEFEEEDTAAQNFSSTPPLSEKKVKTSLFHHFTHCCHNIAYKKFSSEGETEITKEIDEQNTSDNEDFPSNLSGTKRLQSNLKWSLLLPKSSTLHMENGDVIILLGELDNF